MLIDRPFYLSRLEGFIGAPLAKVLTGIRRGGKSTLLLLLKDRLIARGVDPARIVLLQFDAMQNDGLRAATPLHDYLARHAPADGPFCVLLDEVQEVAGWERVVNSLIARGGVDVYVTGSNSTLLAGDLATYIAGRYVSFEVAPLSFSEFMTFTRETGQGPDDTRRQFERYLVRGGFPGLFAADFSDEDAVRVIADIWASVVVRDVLRHNAIRSPELFERVARFALDNVGSPFSARRVAAFLKSESKPLSHQTVADYIQSMTDAYLLHRTPRYDLRGKAYLSSTEKYYVGDHGLVNSLLGYDPTRTPGLLENIVHSELRLRGYDVSVGKMGDREVDFVAERRGERLYIQVASSALDPATYQRELVPLLAIKDSYPKYLLTLDTLAAGNTRGIKSLYLPDFLLAQGWSE